MNMKRSEYANLKRELKELSDKIGQMDIDSCMIVADGLQEEFSGEIGEINRDNVDRMRDILFKVKDVEDELNDLLT